jgi:drug/metabolite transporter (DMT)-like permease
MYAVFLVLISALLVGASTPASKALLGEIHPVQLAGWLYLGAAVGVTPSLIREGRRFRPKHDRRNLLLLGGAILFGGVLGPVALLLGLRLASAASVSLWLNLELVATALLGYFIFKDHLGPLGWVAVAGVVGSGVVLSVGEGASGFEAALLVALACVFWGLDNHFTALIDEITPAQTTFFKGVAAGSFNLALAMFLGASLPRSEVIAAAMGVGALSYGVSIALYIAAAQNLGATRAQLFFATAPFFGAFLSWLVLAESLTTSHFVAGGMLVGSLVFLFGDQHAHRHTHEVVEHEHTHRHDDGHHNHIHQGLPASHRHSHRHRHEPITHSHPHWPDIHHRHSHADQAAANED